MLNLFTTFSSLKSKVRFTGNRLGWRVWSPSIPFQGDKTRCKAASSNYNNIHAGNRNSFPPLCSLKNQTTQRSATPRPEPPNGNSRGPPASPRRLPGGGHWEQGSWSLPPWTSAASPTLLHVAAAGTSEESRGGPLRRRSGRLPGAALPQHPTDART